MSVLPARFSPVVLLAFLWLPAPSGAGYAQAVVFEEDFTEAVPPDGPEGWTLGSGWETGLGGNTTSSPGSGGNNLVHSGSSKEFAVTPVFDLTGVEFATLEYWIRRTGSYDRANLRITASKDGGAAFPIGVLGAGSAAPAEEKRTISVPLPSSLLGEPQVALRFEGLGASSSGTARIDDISVTAYDLADVAARGALQFSERSGSLISGLGDHAIDVPLSLELTSAFGVAGIQFDVGWRADELRLDIARGAAVADSSDWKLRHHAPETENRLRVVLLGQGAAALPSGRYDPFLTLRLRANSVGVPRNDTLVLSNVVGAQALSDSIDAGIAAGDTAKYALLVRPPAPAFSVSDDAFDVGEVDAGGVDSALVRVRNVAAQANLHVRRVTSDNPLFTVRPNFFTVAPGGSMDAYALFRPTHTAFGFQEALLSFEHNGDDSTSAVRVTGKGRGGRGDAEGDGSVDVLDITQVIDFVLAREQANPAQAVAADLFPFPDGDGALDVRDLAVLSQGVARGQWPDAVWLPSVPEMEEEAGKILAYVERIDAGGGRYALRLRYDVPMRGFQFIAPAPAPGVSAYAPADSRVALQSGYDETRGELRIVGYVADGEALEPGVMDIALSGPVDSPRYATVIDEARTRIAVRERPPAALPPEHPDPEAQGQPPYPNPFYACSEALRIPALSPGAEAEVFDMLGRRVFRTRAEGSALEWDGCDARGQAVAPGLYIVRLSFQGKTRTWRVMALR